MPAAPLPHYCRLSAFRWSGREVETADWHRPARSRRWLISFSAMKLPFSRVEFLQVFSDYNESIWPTQILAAALGAAAIVLLFSSRDWSSRLIATILAAFWTLMGVAYHWLFFTAINPAAYLFGGLFIVAALIFLVEGTVRNRVRFEMSRGFRGWAALLLIGYSFVVYPVLGLVATHPYPETPLFGVVPCPTTIFTFGLLLVASYPRPFLLAVVPILWAAIGGSAAFLLDVPQDWGLIVAALIWLAVWIRQRRISIPRTAG